MYRIVCIMGKSSSGKDHIYQALLERKDLDLKRIIMYTTRPKRSGEEEGVEYFFRDEAFVEQMSQKGKVIELREYQTVYGPWKYFTLDDGQIDRNQGTYLMIGTLEVYEALCKYFGEEHVLPIYVEVEDGIRLLRALEREKKQEHPKYKELCRRFLADCEDFSEEKLTRAGIVSVYENNGEIEECIHRIVETLKNI